MAQKKKGKKVATKKVKKIAVKRKVSPAKVSGPLAPLADRVVLRQLEERELGTKSPSGIIIPDTVSKEKPEQGVVVAVGPGKWDEDGERRIPVSVKEGDRVVFSKYGYDEVKVGGVEYYLVSESSILAVITSEAS